jgi:hypothetical protein
MTNMYKDMGSGTTYNIYISKHEHVYEDGLSTSHTLSYEKEQQNNKTYTMKS